MDLDHQIVEFLPLRHTTCDPYNRRVRQKRRLRRMGVGRLGVVHVFDLLRTRQPRLSGAELAGSHEVLPEPRSDAPRRTSQALMLPAALAMLWGA